MRKRILTRPGRRLMTASVAIGLLSGSVTISLLAGPVAHAAPPCQAITCPPPAGGDENRGTFTVWAANFTYSPSIRAKPGKKPAGGRPAQRA